MLLALHLGAVTIPWSDIPRLLFNKAQPHELLLHQVLLEIRLPRLLLSMVVGAVLAVAGTVMQALFRNPLAEPGLLGVSSGAALGAVIAIVLFNASLPFIASYAFMGSFLATICAYLVGKRFNGVSGLLLAGIAINAIAFSIIGLLTYIANDTQLRNLMFWSMGSLSNGSWSILSYLIPWSILWFIFLSSQWQALNALLLGERELSHLGFSIKKLRYHLTIGIAFIVGPCVAITGGISFIGLIVPHILRMLLGANHKYLLPAAMLGGALVLSIADSIARTIIIPAELPVGLLTSLLGGPFFLYLLLRQRQL
ncbi:FecCD family ABC transporter permease [Pelistega europaea]|nr:iron ABC transporter permease [Pelistega europaea]